MNIVPIPAFDDNYIWLIQQGNKVLCVDPGQAQGVIDYLQQHKLQLAAILVTHHHGDHIGGVENLQDALGAVTVYGPGDIAVVNQAVEEGSQWQWEGLSIQVWEVAGHTHNHVAYLIEPSHQPEALLHVFCGDTLFSAGCGRVFCGTIEQLHQSITRLQTLPPTSLFYPAHEYTASNLRFAKSVEPDNRAIDEALLASQNVPTLPVTLAHEENINPFMRLQSERIRHSVREQGFSDENDLAVFASLRRLKNQF